MSIASDIERADRIVAAVHWCQTNRVAIDVTDGLWDIEGWDAAGVSVKSGSKFDFVEAVDALRAQVDPTHHKFKGRRPSQAGGSDNG